MKTTLRFTKMEGLGNDFVMLDGLSEEQSDKIRSQAAALCDRRKGIGADGVICVLPSKRADFRMRIFNADGSEAEMCGNGVRCFSELIRLTGRMKDSLTVDTLAGLIQVRLTSGGLYNVNMGSPRFLPPEIPLNAPGDDFIMKEVAVLDKKFKITAVSMGNPHAVIYADELDDSLLFTYAPAIQKNPLFPKSVNVEFVKILSPSEIRIRVYERGCGETQACGTGACAAAVSGIVSGLHGNDVTAHLPGGDLLISWDGDRTHSVFKSGPARAAFSGTVEAKL